MNYKSVTIIAIVAVTLASAGLVSARGMGGGSRGGAMSQGGKSTQMRGTSGSTSGVCKTGGATAGTGSQYRGAGPGATDGGFATGTEGQAQMREQNRSRINAGSTESGTGEQLRTREHARMNAEGGQGMQRQYNPAVPAVPATPANPGEGAATPAVPAVPAEN